MTQGESEKTWRWVACFIRNDLSYNTKSFLPSEIENIFIEIFLTTFKAPVVTIYRPSSQGSFTETITEHFLKINRNDTKIYILGDFNINLFLKQRYIFHQTNTQSVSHEVKSYFQFCSLHGLEQLIKSPTRVTCSTSSLIDHILTTFPERVSQQGIIDVGLSDHQLIYCTRKFSRTKLGTHKQITFRSLKNYTAEAYKEALGKVCFPDYENFSDVNKAYENFIQKLMSIIDKLAPFKTKRVKGNSQEWFDGEILESKPYEINYLRNLSVVN